MEPASSVGTRPPPSHGRLPTAEPPARLCRWEHNSDRPAGPRLELLAEGASRSGLEGFSRAPLNRKVRFPQAPRHREVSACSRSCRRCGRRLPPLYQLDVLACETNTDGRTVGDPAECGVRELVRRPCGRGAGRIIAVALRLQIDWPALRRPLSGQILGSRFKNMKELIPPRGRVVRHEHSDRGRDLRATPRE